MSVAKVCPACGSAFERRPGYPLWQWAKQITCSKSCATRLRHMKGEKLGITPKPVAERFWSKVQKTECCWIWTASSNPNGYGQLSRGIGKAPFTAHRLSWEMHKGPIPPGRHVLHRCDNPRCVHPAHLFLGDAWSNALDKVGKGRARGGSNKGETNPSAKLTYEKAASIKDDSRSSRELGRVYGVSKSTILAIKNGQSWNI